MNDVAKKVIFLHNYGRWDSVRKVERGYQGTHLIGEKDEKDCPCGPSRLEWDIERGWIEVE